MEGWTVLLLLLLACRLLVLLPCALGLPLPLLPLYLLAEEALIKVSAGACRSASRSL